MDNKGDINQPDCCDGDQCCSPTQGSKGRKIAFWKTLIFSGVLLLACAVVAYSLFWRSDKTTDSVCCPPGSAAAAACGQTEINPDFDHLAALVGLSITVVTNSGEGLSSEKLDTIGEVRAFVESHEAQLQFETLESGDTAFLKLVNKYGIESFPAVIIKGEDNVLVLSENQISADTILSVFQPRSTSAAPCGVPEKRQR